MYYIGLDPGQSGAIAVLDHLGVPQNVLTLGGSLDHPNDVLQFLRRYAALGPCVAVLEHVWAQLGMGGTGGFSFGGSYHSLQMALTAADIPYTVAIPRKWQDAMHCRTGGDKNITKAAADQRFGQVFDITHAIADSLLIAEYCRLTHKEPYGQEGKEGRQAPPTHRRQEAGIARLESAIQILQAVNRTYDTAFAAQQAAPRVRAGQKSNPR